MIIRDPALGRVMDVTMLGPRSTGKTSLLVSLYDQFQAVTGPAIPLELSTSDPDTRATLEGYRQELRQFARGGPARVQGLAQTQFVREYLFGLGRRGRRPPELTLRFTDVPGEVLTAGSGPARDRLDTAVGRSGLLFLAIDSPALMERDGQRNDEVNRPDLVMDFVRDALSGGGDRLVLLVPLKCEKYMLSPGSARELAEAVRRRYRPLTNYLAGMDADGAARGGAVLTPVQTVGSMRFSRFEAEGSNFREVFRLVRMGAEYDPRDTDQPLRWMLRFVVNAYRRRERTFGEWLGDFFTSADATYTEALAKFGADCKEQDGFQILVRHPYLELP